MLSREEVELYRRDGYLPGRRLLSPEEAERFRDDCLRTCAKPIELADQNPYSLKRHASNRVKPYLFVPLGRRAGARSQDPRPGRGRKGSSHGRQSSSARVKTAGAVWSGGSTILSGTIDLCQAAARTRNPAATRIWNDRKAMICDSVTMSVVDQPAFSSACRLFTPAGIRGAVCHKIEMALAVRRTPRFTLAPSRLAPATSKPFARAN
jgi:hypothetical protein